MKSLFTFLLSCLMVFAMHAQDLTLNITEITLDSAGHISYGDVTITNNSNDPIELALRLERVCLNNGDETHIQICMGVSCFFGVNTTTTWGDDTSQNPLYVLQPGETYNDFLKLTISPQGAFASEWDIVAFDRNNPETKATLKVIIDDDTLESCTPTGTDDFAYTIGKAYPNPATAFINIPYAVEANDAQLHIYNTLGVLVKRVAINAQESSVAVPVADLADGVYFYYITDGKDQSKMMSFVK